jgi:hypothetical protein
LSWQAATSEKENKVPVHNILEQEKENKVPVHNILEPVLGQPSQKESKTGVISKIW